jgi:hypothetical protein
MPVSKEEAIREIKNHKDKRGNPYNYINTSSGLVPLENAPISQLMAFYWRLKRERKKLATEVGWER